MGWCAPTSCTSLWKWNNVSEEVGVDGHKWDKRGGGQMWLWLQVSVRLWKNTSNATPSAWLCWRPLLNHPSIVFFSPPHEIVPVPLTCCCKSSFLSFCHFCYLPLSQLLAFSTISVDSLGDQLLPQGTQPGRGKGEDESVGPWRSKLVVLVDFWEGAQ